MSPWAQRMARDREEISLACGEYDKAIDAEPTTPIPARVDRRIFLDTDSRLPNGTFVSIIKDFVEDKSARRYTVDVGPDTRKMSNASLCLERAAVRLGALVYVRMKRGLVFIER